LIGNWLRFRCPSFRISARASWSPGLVEIIGWTADSAKTKIDDGIDTFVFKDGFIRAPTARYTLQRK